MASVRMTIALKERLTETYKKQCQTAYNSSLNVDSTVKTIVEAIQTLDRPGSGTADAREFAQLIETAEQMHKACLKKIPKDLFLSVAAVSDWKVQLNKNKIKKNTKPPNIKFFNYFYLFVDICYLK